MKYTFYMIGLSLVACFTHADTVTVRVSPAAVPELTWSTQPLGVYSVSASDQAEGPFNVLVSSNVVATGYSTSLLCPTVAVAKSKLYYRVETVSAGCSDYLILDVSGGTNAVSWPVTGTNAIPDLLTNPDYRTTKVVMRLIGSGSFKMLGVYDVTLTRPYYIGVFEMTQAQYTNMVGGVNTSINVGPTRPVDNVSFAMLRGGLADGAGYGWPTNNLVASNSIIGRVRAMTGSDNFDLPTSAQWEYASRAGTTTDFYNGTDANPESSTDFSMVTNIARCYANRNIAIDGYTSHAPVGSYQPNAWGIYDTHGNVAELLLDYWGGEAPASVDPVGPDTGSGRLFRGGQSGSPNISYLKNSVTTSAGPDSIYSGGVMGFRLALRVPEDETLGQANGGSERPVITQVLPRTVPMISWPTQPGMVYGLFRSENPYGPFETQISTNLVADGHSLSLVDVNAVGGSFYYKVEELAPGYARYMIVDVGEGAAATDWPVTYTNVIPDLLTDDIYKTNKIVLKLLPAATYTMRQPVNTGVPVTLTRPFYAGVFEVTCAQYTKVTGVAKGLTSYPVGDVSYNSIRGSTTEGINWPATSNEVSAASFMGLLQAKAGVGTLFFDLPTDAQCEYAWRAGTTSHFNNGRNAASTGDWVAINDIAWHKVNSGGGSHVVGLLYPNGFGLYDMHGNVTEFCLDYSWNGPTSYAIDPTGPEYSSGSRVYRGGTYSSPDLSTLYSAKRGSFPSASTQGNIGFRLYCQLPE